MPKGIKQCICCGKDLVGKQRKWCSQSCRHKYSLRNNKEYREKKRKRSLLYQKIRYQTDPMYRAKNHLRRNLRKFLQQNNCRKGSHSSELLGATPERIRSHIESQFKDDMTWENYGEWHIDHIIPLDYYNKNFDLNDLEVQKKAFNYKNLQPLWAFENLSKSNKCEILETAQ